MADLPDPTTLVNQPSPEQPYKLDTAPPEIQAWVERYCRVWVGALEAGEPCTMSWYNLHRELQPHFKVSRPSITGWVAKRHPDLYAYIKGHRYGG